MGRGGGGGKGWRGWEGVEGVGRGQTCMLHMHAYVSSAFSKGGTSGTLVWTPSQSAPQANRAYSCGSGGRGPPSMK